MKQTIHQIILLSLLPIFFTACENSQPQKAMARKEVQIDKSPATCPHLTRDSKGQTVLSWVSTPNDSTTAFCYATSREGKSFTDPVIIPGSQHLQPHGENLPKIIFKASGEVIALWGEAHPNPKNKYAGRVLYTQSFDGGKTWNQPRPLVGDTAGHDQRYYDVALLPNGEAGIIWLDNRKTTAKEGSALYFASTDGRKGFGKGKLISQPCCPCCRTDLFVDEKGGIHALFRGILQDSIRDMVHMVSNDGGASFSSPQRISPDNWVIHACPHTGPAMTGNREGIHFAWFTEGRNKGCFYTRTIDNGERFLKPDRVCAQGSHPQLTSLPHGEILIVWDESHVSGNQVFKRVGLQRRNAAGKDLGKEYLTSENGNCSYPVIAAVDSASVLVAYCLQKDHQQFVAYQLVQLE